MNIFVYSDESGVFDAEHNSIFAFGGVVFLSKTGKDATSRKFIKAENDLRRNPKNQNSSELKACKISPKEKGKLFRSLNNVIKFGVVIKQKRILKEIYTNKKSKQRYLDYAYKIALKRCFEKLIIDNYISPNEIHNIYIFVDEHTTATDGKYELSEALEQEFKHGTFNHAYSKFFPPIFCELQTLEVKFCNSAATPLVRAADIVANKIYHEAVNSVYGAQLFKGKKNMYVIDLP